MKKLLFAIVFLVSIATVSKAEMVTFNWDYATGETQTKFAEALSLKAEDVETGVKFTLTSNYTLSDNPKIKDGIAFYNTNDVFGSANYLQMTGNQFTGDFTGAYYPSANAPKLEGGIFKDLGNMDLYLQADKTSFPESNTFSWTLGYGSVPIITDMGDVIWQSMTWDDFISAVNDTENPFTVAFHGQALASGASAKVYTTGIANNATPEPATLALVGLGLAGVGLVSRRKRGKI